MEVLNCIVWMSPLLNPQEMRSLEKGCQARDVSDDASTNRRTSFQSSVEKIKRSPSSLPLAKNLPFGEKAITVTDSSCPLSVVSWRYGNPFIRGRWRGTAQYSLVLKDDFSRDTEGVGMC